MSEVTRLLHRVRGGDQSALDELMPLVYGELRRIARAFMRRRQGQTLQPTAVVNEAFIKLFDDARPDVADRAHFLALMSRVMRQVLVDHARSAAADKRGGGAPRVPWDSTIEVPSDRGAEQLKLLGLHTALEALEQENAKVAEVVQMHYFRLAILFLKQNHVVRTPRSTTSEGDVGHVAEALNASLCNVNRFQFAVGIEGHVSVIWRPERVVGAIGAQERPRGHRLERSHPQRRLG